LTVLLRWKRGYQLGLEKVLKIEKTPIKLSNFDLIDPDIPCKVDEGVIKAKYINNIVIIYNFRILKCLCLLIKTAQAAF